MSWMTRLWRGRKRRPLDSHGDAYEAIAGDYGRYRADYPPAFFERLARLGVGVAPQRVLDVGTGTGILARGFARRGCSVTGVDTSSSMLAEARRLDAEAGVAVTYVSATAEATGLDAEDFDVVAASMAWPFAGGAQAMREFLRVLRPRGAVVFCHLNRVNLPGSVSEASNRLIETFGLVAPSRANHGLKPDLVGALDDAGLSRVESFSVDTVVPFSHDAWCGRVRSIPTVGPRLSAPRDAEFSRALRDLLARDFKAEPMLVVHRAFAAIGFRSS